MGVGALLEGRLVEVAAVPGVEGGRAGSAAWGREVPGAVLPGAKAAKGGSSESVVGTGGEQLLCKPHQFSSVAGEFWILRKRYRGSQCSVAHDEVGVEKILGYGVEKRGTQGTQGFHVRIFKAVPPRGRQALVVGVEGEEMQPVQQSSA